MPNIALDSILTPPTHDSKTIHSQAPPSPISLLPDEVLADIFEIARDLVEEAVKDLVRIGKGRHTQVPLLVSLVCSHWRTVAFAHPLLWNHLNISPPWNPRMLHFWLQKSQACPIQLHIMAQMVERGRENYAVGWNGSLNVTQGWFDHLAYLPLPSLFHTLVDHFPRCQSIVFQVSQEFSALIPRFIKEIERTPAPLPLLEKFCLQKQVVPGLASRIQPRKAELFGEDDQAPRLTDVKIGYPFLLLSFRQVTSLHLQAVFFTFAEFWKIMHQFRALRLLAIYDSFKDHWPAAKPVLPPHVRALPSLTSLQLYNFPHVSDLLLSIAAPNLQDLIMGSVLRDGLTGFYEKQRSEAERFPALRTIAITIYRENRALLFYASKCFPRVEQATLYQDNILKLLPDLLVVGDEIIWPRLHTLAIVGGSQFLCGEEGRDILREVIDSREAADVPLRKIYLDEKVVAGMDGAFRDWLKEGVEIVEKDVWTDVRRNGMYYPERSFL